MEQQKENELHHETIGHEITNHEVTDYEAIEHAAEQLQENHTESRSEYQKRKRDEKKEQKRKKRRSTLAIFSVLVILAGILCGTLLSGKINTPHDAIVIASANVQHIKYTVGDTIAQLTDKLPWNQKEPPIIPPADQSETPGEVPNEEPNEELNTSTEVPNESNNPIENTEGAESVEGIENADGNVSVENTENTENSEGNESNESTTNTPPVTSDNPFGIDPSKPMVALTFDDGPSQYTWPIVTALQEHNARATFFLVGNRVATHQAAIEFTQANHNEIASHSFSHADLGKSTEEEILSQIQKTDKALQEQHQYTPTLFRVPYGERNATVLEILRQQGKPVIGWSVDPRDWESQDKDAIVSHVLSHVKDGDIVLMHDLYKPTADAVVELVPALQAKGYQLVTVSELLQYKGIEATPGTYYYASWKWV